MKIFVAGIATETNTFAPLPTGLEDFLVQRGRDLAAGRIGHPGLDLSQLWGPQASARGDQLIFSLNAWAQPSGMTLRSAYESLRDEILRDLKEALPVDIVLLLLHGAMVANGYDDCEADLMRRAREIIGPEAVLGVEFDLHCHLSETKLAPADVVVTYKEYPHVDVRDRARELFDLAVATRNGQIRPTMALFDCRMIGLYPTSREPLREFVEAMTHAEREEGVLSISFAHGFQFADMPHVGAKMLVVTDDDVPRAQRIARELGQRVYALRHEIGFDALTLPMEQALQEAMRNERFPVVVADQSDNIGAGAPGDATFALRWLLGKDATDVAMAIFYDPEVVRIAKKAGVGAKLAVRLGGKLGPTSGIPVDMDVTVLAVRENYMHQRPQRSGVPLLFAAGDVAALRCGSIDIVVSSLRCQCYCPSIFSDLGIDPRRKRLLIPKSMQHFQRGFSPIAAGVIYMVAPGAVPPDPKHIRYRRLDTTRLYPWNDDPFASGR